MSSTKRFAAGVAQTPPRSAKQLAAMIVRAAAASALAEQHIHAGRKRAAQLACRQASSLLSKVELQLARALDRP